MWLAVAPAFAAQPAPNVLVLYSDNRVLPAVALIDETVDAVLRAEGLGHAELFKEFLDLGEARGDGYPRQLADFLGNKYAATPIQAIVAVREPALHFIVAQRDRLFPGVPIVHFEVDGADLEGSSLPADVIGAAVQPAPLQTIEMAMRLHPKARHLVVITGTAQLDRHWEALAKRAFKPLDEERDKARGEVPKK